MLLGSGVRKVFLTGGSGFIGSHIVDRLLADGYEVTAYDNFSNGCREFIGRPPRRSEVQACGGRLPRFGPLAARNGRPRPRVAHGGEHRHHR